MRPKFHDVHTGPTYEVCLVLNQDEYKLICKQIDFPHLDDWMPQSGIACLHTFKYSGRRVFVVAIDDEFRTSIDVAALLVHEATHIKQRIMEDIGEDEPSKEYEAYTMQNIAYSLFEQYQQKRAR